MSLSAKPTTRTHRRGGFTLVEMLTTVAALVILLGLMVNLAGIVRRESANDITKQILYELDREMQQYVKMHADLTPEVTALIPGAQPGDEKTLLRDATLNNKDFVRILRSERLLSPLITDQPQSYYDGEELRDAWGTPIVFMPHYNKFIGQAQRPFFFVSAGPDRKFLTIDDNLNSYE